MNSFNWSFVLIGQYADWMLSGVLLSMQMLVTSVAVCIPLSMVIAIMRSSQVTVLKAAGACYVEVMRNIPLLAHMLFWYFGVPELLPEYVKSRLYAGNYELTSASIALILYTSAYMAEDLRSGIRSVADEQMETARSLGFSFLSSMRLVILPQAFKVVIPPLISQVLSLWKNTSVGMTIGVMELMFQASQVESATFRWVEPFAVATAVYVLISLMISSFAALAGRKLARGISSV